jgi:hypothetical protein
MSLSDDELRAELRRRSITAPPFQSLWSAAAARVQRRRSPARWIALALLAPAAIVLFLLFGTRRPPPPLPAPPTVQLPLEGLLTLRLDGQLPLDGLARPIAEPTPFAGFDTRGRWP